LKKLPEVRIASARAAAALALGLLLAGPAAADMEKARTIAATVCVTCHGADGNSTVPNFPKLAGQQADYLVRQLNAFITGRRPSDVMVPIVTALDPGDFKALGNYFAAQKPTSETVLDKEAAERGRKLYFEGDEERGIPACSGCHMDDAGGNKRFPRLAGQHREYVIAELTNFKSAARSKGIGRVMREVAALLKDDEIKAVAEFLAGL
jgi:cytochrome c553